MIGIVRIVVVGVGQLGLERAIADLDGIGASADLDDRCVAEVCAEPLRVDRRGRDDEFQIGTLRQQPGEIADQEVDVQAALVRLVQDERVVAAQHPVALDLGEQDAVGHQLDERAVADLVGEPHRVADDITERRVQLVGDALRDRARGEPARLGVPDRAAHAAAEFETDLGQLGRLARTGLARDDDDLVVANCRGEVVAFGADRQVGIGDRRQRCATVGDEQFAAFDLARDRGEVAGATRLPQPLAEPGLVGERHAVETGPKLGGGRCGHSSKPMGQRLTVTGQQIVGHGRRVRRAR